MSSNHTFGDKDTRKDDMSAAIDTWVEELTEGVTEATKSDEFKEYLDVVSNFHDYSQRNLSLIHLQKPDATRVAGFNTWKNDFNRTVKEGESAIWIWAPIITERCPECENSESYHESINCDYDDTEPSEWNRGIVGFRTVPVFDVSQTEGDDIPTLTTEARGDATGLRDALLSSASELGVPAVDFQDESEWEHGQARGVSKKSSGAVTVLKRENEADMVRTMIHEFAHSMLHTGSVKTEERTKREVEAESVAYVVGRYFGLDVSNSSFYLASWSGEEPEAIKERLDRISQTSQEIIKTVDDNLVGAKT